MLCANAPSPDAVAARIYRCHLTSPSKYLSTMKIVTYNIQYGRGRDGVFDLDRIAGEVSGADVIALQEVERFWSRSGGADQPRLIASRFPDHYAAFGPGVDLHLAGTGPGEESAGRRRQFGNMLLSRTPLLTVRHHLLPKYGSLGLPMSLQRSVLEGVIAVRGGHVRVYSVHLTHLSSATRLPQVEALLRIHANAVREGPPLSGSGLGEEWTRDGMPAAMPREAILAGDFNMEHDCVEYERIVGPMSAYGGRITNPEGFVDAWVEAGHAVDAGTTCAVRGRPVRLDYCFASSSLKDRIRAVRIDSDAVGSDHQPLWVDFDL